MSVSKSNQVINFRYSIATEHEHSCCILIAREDKFKPRGIWHTWIDYDKFDELIHRYYSASQGQSSSTSSSPASAFSFSSEDYMARTPDWAIYKAPERGFDPVDSRWRRKQGQVGNDACSSSVEQLAEEPYEATESGCG